MIDSNQRVTRLGFYPQPENGELAYSLAARASCILFPDLSIRRINERFLGRSDLTLGGLIPNNGHRLLERVPAISGLNETSLIDGSVYHIISPFLDQAERLGLRRSIFDSDARGTRGFIRVRGQSGASLRYCPVCARQAVDKGQPLTWQVIPNFPGVNCCPIHACFLEFTSAQLNPERLHNPTDFVEKTGASQISVAAPDLAFAADVAALYASRSNCLPGFGAIAAKIRRRLLTMARYSTLNGRVRWARVVGDLCDAIPATLARVDPRLRNIANDGIMRSDVREPVARYLIISRAAGISVSDLLTPTNEKEFAPHLSSTTPCESDFNRYARERLFELSKGRLFLGRKSILHLAPAEAAFVRKTDRLFYESVMPVRARRGRNSNFDWAAKDRRIWLAVRGAVDHLQVIPNSGPKILAFAGVSRYALQRARGRLPLTKQLISFLLRCLRATSNGRIYFPFYLVLTDRSDDIHP